MTYIGTRACTGTSPCIADIQWRNMNTKNYRFPIAYGILIFLVLILLACNISIGSILVPFQDVLHIVTGGSAEPVYQDIVLQIRFPRAVAAMILGGALALSGYLLQTFFHNPIAGPFVLGISSGAKLTVALLMIFCLAHALPISSFLMIFAKIRYCVAIRAIIWNCSTAKSLVAQISRCDGIGRWHICHQ